MASRRVRSGAFERQNIGRGVLDDDVREDPIEIIGGSHPTAAAFRVPFDQASRGNHVVSMKASVVPGPTHPEAVSRADTHASAGPTVPRCVAAVAFFDCRR